MQTKWVSVLSKRKWVGLCVGVDEGPYKAEKTSWTSLLNNTMASPLVTSCDLYPKGHRTRDKSGRRPRSQTPAPQSTAADTSIGPERDNRGVGYALICHRIRAPAPGAVPSFFQPWRPQQPWMQLHHQGRYLYFLHVDFLGRWVCRLDWVAGLRFPV